jgi:hypothetical protein
MDKSADFGWMKNLEVWIDEKTGKNHDQNFV